MLPVSVVVLTEDGEVLLGVVHVADEVEDRLPGQHGPCAHLDGTGGGAGKEDRTGVALHAVPDPAVLPARSRQEGGEVVELIGDADIVAALRGGHIGLEVEVADGDGILRHGVLRQALPQTVDKALGPREIHVEIQRSQNVFQRGGTLCLEGHIPGGQMVLLAAVAVEHLKVGGDLILLAGGHALCPEPDDPKARIGGRQLGDGDAAVVVVDVVALESCGHLPGGTGAGDMLVQPLVKAQGAFPELHAVDPYVGLLRADGHGGRIVLAPGIGGTVADGRTALNALQVDPGQGVLVLRLDVQAKLDLPVLAVEDLHGLQLRGDGGLLGLQDDAHITGLAPQQLRVVIADIPGLEDELQISARGAAVGVEEAPVQLHGAAALDDKGGDALLVLPEAAAHPVEVLGEGQAVVCALAVGVAEAVAPGLGIAVTGRIQIQDQPGGDGPDRKARIRDLHSHRPHGTAAADAQHMAALLGCLVCPGPDLPAHILQHGYSFRAVLQGNVSRLGGRIHRKPADGSGAVLAHGDSRGQHTHHRGGHALPEPHTHMGQRLG